MADEVEPEPVVDTALRNGERRAHERRRAPRHDGHRDRRRWHRRGRRLATAGMFLSTLGLHTGATGSRTGWMSRGAALPLVRPGRPPLETLGVYAAPGGFHDQSEFFIRPATNAQVKAAIEAYRARADFGHALGRGSRYLAQFQAILAAARVPPELVYLALVESEFRPDARSWVSAFGMWQFMPETGERFGLRQDAWIDERGDPVKGAEAAAKYLRALYDQFHDWNLAMAAYNAGERAVARAIERQGTSDFWELSRRGALPQETRDYVPRIHAAMTIARDPARYGVIVTPEDALRTDAVAIESPVDLQIAARCLDTDVERVLDLNPALKRPATPPEAAFLLRVPEGRGADVRACLDRVPADQRIRIHIVEPGQTLTSVAHIYRTAPSRLAEVNALNPRQKLPEGLELVIPIDLP
jgi:peptidoglycan lytic transglycosylase D